MPANFAICLAKKPSFMSSMRRTLPVHIAITFAVMESTSPGCASGSTYFFTSSAALSPTSTKCVWMA